MSAPSAEEVANAAAAVAEIEWNAAVRCQRAFRQRVARRHEIADQLRHLIFGPAAITATAVAVRESSAARLSSAGDVEVPQLAPAEYAARWKPDNGFRDALAINVLYGHEQLYLRYAMLEDCIAREDWVTADEEQPSARQGLLRWFTRGRLDSEHSIFVECVNELREELHRIDVEFVASVAALTSTVRKLKEEATPKPILGRGLYERETLDILQQGRTRGLKNALKDVYKKTFILLQASSLNYVGVCKLQIRAKAKLGSIIAAKAELPSREELRSRPFFLQMSDSAPPSTKDFFAAIYEVENMYANMFALGNLEKARGYLRSFRKPTAEKPQVFVIGLKLGISLALLVWAMWLMILQPARDLECPFCTQYLSDTLPVFRILLVPVVGTLAWALCVRQWEKQSINYIYVLQMNAFRHRSSFQTFENAINALVVWLAAFVLYTGAIRTGMYLIVPPMVYPPALLCMGLMYCFWPSSRNSPRNYFWPAFMQTIIRPFGKPVSFTENLVADMLTSAVIVLRDIGTTIGFYLCGGLFGIPSADPPAWLKHIQGPLITMLPYWWRFMQCLRRSYDAPSFREALPQLVNAGKYAISLVSITMAVIGCEHGCSHFYTDWAHWTAGRCTWFAALVLGTLYSYVWDITMDWSLLEKAEDGQRCCFGFLPMYKLRKKRGFSWTWFYYWAAASNLIGRLSWALSINPNSIASVQKSMPLLASPQVRTTIVAVVEVLRRGQWTMLRVENEVLSNASHYRNVADVPVMITFAEMTLGKTHINARSIKHHQQQITVKDGIAILLAVAAAAAAGTVVYLAIQQQH